MKRIVYRTEGGDLAIVMPASSTKFSIEEIAAKDVPEGRPREIIDSTQLPADRFFRMAWTYSFDEVSNASEKNVEIDMEKARTIAEDFIRDARRPAFGKLDIEYMRASEAKDESKMESIAALKQLLRDLPADPRIEAAQTPEELEHLATTAVSEAVAKSKDNKSGEA